MILNIIEAKHIQDYQLWIKFSNGIAKTVDLKEVIFKDQRKIFHPLRDLEYFKRFSIQLNTVTWPNEADFAPEFLDDIGHLVEQAA